MLAMQQIDAMQPYVCTGGRGDLPWAESFWYPPSSAAEIKKEKEKFGGEVAKFFTFLATKPPKIDVSRLLFAKMAEFTAIWRASSYITLLPPLHGDIDRAHVSMQQMLSG